MDRFVQLEAVAVPMSQPNIDTDQIIPARFLSRSREVDHGQFLFHDAGRLPGSEEEHPDFPLNRPEWRRAQVVVGGRNFGCGSSRESAVWALHDYGIRAAIAPSFGDIFYNNSLKNGLLPVVLPAEVVNDLMMQLEAQPGATVAIDLPSQTVTAPDGGVHAFEIDSFAKHCLLEGVDELAFTLGFAEDIAAFEHRYGRENTR